ncbi:major capsid protein [Vibrio phage 237E40-1]|nr:major capsid protein [Vibrio phage 237E40-1]
MAVINRDVSKAFVELFESEVHQAYQEEGDKLAGTVRTKTGVTGTAVHFPIYGKGAAVDRGASSSDVPVMGVGAKSVQCDLARKIAADYSDVFDEASLNFDDRQELAMAIGYAMRRCEDQMIIDAQNKAHTAGGAQAPNVVAADYGSTGTDGPLTITKVKRAMTLLNRKGVPRKDRYFLYTPDGLDALLDDVKVGSSDYNKVQPLVNGEVDEYLGFKFIMISDEEVTVIDPTNNQATTTIKTGLPGVGTASRKYFAYHRRAVGYSNSIDKTTMADWVAQKASFLIQSHLYAGSVVIDPTGYVTILCKETV